MRTIVVVAAVTVALASVAMVAMMAYSMGRNAHPTTANNPTTPPAAPAVTTAPAPSVAPPPPVVSVPAPAAVTALAQTAPPPSSQATPSDSPAVTTAFAIAKQAEEAARQILRPSDDTTRGSASAVPAKSVSLHIRDRSGVEVDIRNVDIDYTVHSGGAVDVFTPDHTREGLRALLGEGHMELRWSELREVRFIETVKRGERNLLKAEITTRSGITRPMELVLQGASQLSGTADVGQYRTSLERIASITVRSEP